MVWDLSRIFWQRVWGCFNSFQMMEFFSPCWSFRVFSCFIYLFEIGWNVFQLSELNNVRWIWDSLRFSPITWDVQNHPNLAPGDLGGHLVNVYRLTKSSTSTLFWAKRIDIKIIWNWSSNDTIQMIEHASASSSPSTLLWRSSSRFASNGGKGCGRVTKWLPSTSSTWSETVLPLRNDANDMKMPKGISFEILKLR